MTKNSKFDPFGKGYDEGGAKRAGLTRAKSGKNKGHLGSLDPRSGKVLKGMRHDSATQMRAVEELLGNKIQFNSNTGRYYSKSKRVKNPNKAGR